MSDLPKTQRVRILDGKRAGEVGLFEKTYPDGMSSILINGSQVTFCRQYVVLTAREEAELIAKARGNDLEQDVESDSTNMAELKKRRGPKPGTKYKTRTTRASEERHAEDTQPEPMIETGPTFSGVEVRSSALDQTTPETQPEPMEVHRPTPGIGLRYETSDNLIIPDMSVPLDDYQPASSPLLIIVEPDGTTVLSTTVTKDNVMVIIRSLIDLMA